MTEATDGEKEDEYVQFPAGLSEMGNTDTTPRRCKVTAVAAYWSMNEIGLKMSFCGEKRKGILCASPGDG
jgi:hypothetical protein